MTPPAKTLIGSKINYFQGSIALCHTGSIARGFSNRRDNEETRKLAIQCNTRPFLKGDYLSVSAEQLPGEWRAVKKCKIAPLS